MATKAKIKVKKARSARGYGWGLMLMGCLFFAFSASAVPREETTNLQLHFGLNYRHDFKYGLALSVGEELRTVLCDYDLSNHHWQQPVAYFNRSYTSVGLTYQPIRYFSVAAEYVLRLYGDKGWQDPRRFIRHRVYVSLTGTYPIQDWKISVQERLQWDGRMDEVDLTTTNPNRLLLRHRLRVDYAPKNQKIAPYVLGELTHTLNDPFAVALHAVRAEIGAKYSFNQHQSLTFFYRFHLSYTQNWENNQPYSRAFISAADFAHCLGLFWNLNW